MDLQKNGYLVYLPIHSVKHPNLKPLPTYSSSKSKFAHTALMLDAIWLADPGIWGLNARAKIQCGSLFISVYQRTLKTNQSWRVKHVIGSCIRFSPVSSATAVLYAYCIQKKKGLIFPSFEFSLPTILYSLLAVIIIKLWSVLRTEMWVKL